MVVAASSHPQKRLMKPERSEYPDVRVLTEALVDFPDAASDLISLASRGKSREDVPRLASHPYGLDEPEITSLSGRD
jgi:hypothetical protein